MLLTAQPNALPSLFAPEQIDDAPSPDLEAHLVSLVFQELGVSMPPELPVSSAGGYQAHQQLLHASVIEPTSALFRAHTELDKVLIATHAATPKNRPLKIISAGCSFGAEIDSLLALGYRYIPDRDMQVTGIDSNRLALQAVSAALYHTYAGLAQHRKEYETYDQGFDDIMRAFGITVLSHEGPDDAHVDLNTRKLRNRYPVIVNPSDVRQSQGEADADLIVCNNVLFHQSHEDARQTVFSLAGQLALGGVISFGATVTKPRQVPDGSGRFSYGIWWDDMIESLSRQGVEFLDTGDPSLRAFQRIA